MTLELAQFILSAITALILAILFVYKPQVKSGRDVATITEAIKGIRESLHAQISELDRRLTNLQENHIHTLETKQDHTDVAVSQLRTEVTRLATVIEERIPRK